MTASAAPALGSNVSLSAMQDLLAFPFRQPRWREKLLLLALFTLAGFAIPLLPHLVILGYGAEISRVALAEGRLHLPEWAQWDRLLRDGLKLLGAALLYALPAIGLIVLGYMLMMVTPVFIAFLDQAGDQAELFSMGPFLLGALAAMSILGLGFLLAFITGLIVPPALMHLIASGDFMAAFRYREWWPILRANLAGFIWAYVLYWGASFLLSFAVQVLYMTLILCCLVPFALIGISAYLTPVYHAVFALAYREGRQKLAV